MSIPFDGGVSVLYYRHMNKNIHTIIIVMLAVGLLVTGAGVYLLSTQLADLKETIKAPPKVSAESPNGKCVNSGGAFVNGKCSCGKDYFLENDQCMGQDGLTKIEIELIKANQEELMNKSR